MKIIAEADTPQIIVDKIAAIRMKPRDQLNWPELFVLDGYDWQKGTLLIATLPIIQPSKPGKMN